MLLAGDIDHDLFDGKELLRINFPDDTSVNRYAIDNTSIDDAWVSGFAPHPGSAARHSRLAQRN